jgi:ubiquinone/menaquinone biosynthesis C-methylase UbiE
MVSFLDPSQIIEKLSLDKDLLAAEFGCGPGGFAIPLAKELSKGIVYGLDIQEEPLSALKGRAKSEGLSNIRTIKCDLEEPKGSALPDDSLDLVVVSNVLFQSQEKEAMLKEAKRILKPGARMFVVDWKPEAPFGPQEARVSLEEIEKIAKRLEIKMTGQIDAGTYHWAAVFQKEI